MKIGIGFNNEEDAKTSGLKIASQAVETGGIKNASFAIAFCSSSVNAQDLLYGIREVLGAGTPVLGGSGIGIITNSTISYENYPAGIVVIEDNDIQLQFASASGLDKDERQTGRDLAGLFSFKDGDTLLFFYDSLKTPSGENGPPVINSSKPLIQGMEDIIDKDVLIIGGGLIGDYNFSSSIQFTGDSVQTQNAAALLLRGDIQSDWKIMHGCTPKDGLYYTITKIEGPVIYELDNRPVVEVINEMYGNKDWQKQTPVKRLAIGKNHGEKFGLDFIEENYVTRLILGLLPDKSGIILFETDFEAGEEIQFMLRDSKTIIDSARTNTENIFREIKEKGKIPRWGFYIDCAGRKEAASEAVTDEAAEVQSVFNANNVPLFGFYSGVEIAPFVKKTRGLDWTGVLIMFSQ